MKKSLIFIILLLFFASCTIYVPESIYTPTFRNKGEKQAELCAGLSGVGLNLGYAPTQHFAGTFGFSSQVSSDTSSDQVNRKQINIALGYYTLKNKNITFEYFGGFSNGTYTHSNNQVSHNIKYSSIYFQPDFGMTSKMGEISFTPRLNYFTLNETNSASKAGLFLFQPTLNFGFGYKNIYFFINQSLQLPLTKAPDWFVPLPYSLNFGIRLKFGRIFDTNPRY